MERFVEPRGTVELHQASEGIVGDEEPEQQELELDGKIRLARARQVRGHGDETYGRDADDGVEPRSSGEEGDRRRQQHPSQEPGNAYLPGPRRQTAVTARVLVHGATADLAEAWLVRTDGHCQTTFSRDRPFDS